MSKTILTKEGYEKMVEELTYLKSTKRKEVAEQLATARAHGDLRENAEYDAAKEAKAHLETRIQKLELKLSQAKVVDTNDMPKDKSFVGATLSLKNLNTGDTMKYMLVPEDEADFSQGKISVTSPIGKGLLGRKVKEQVEIQVPAGLLKFEVLEIKYG